MYTEKQKVELTIIFFSHGKFGLQSQLDWAQPAVPLH